MAGPITKIIDGYAQDFQALHKDIRIKPVYAGNYDDTIAKAITAFKGGKAPPLAMLGAIQVFSLIDLDAIVPIDELASSADDKAWLKASGLPSWPTATSRVMSGACRSNAPTAVLYWNKDAFKEAGLDPEKAPVNWTEQSEMGRKLVMKSGSTVSRWGVQSPRPAAPIGCTRRWRPRRVSR